MKLATTNKEFQNLFANEVLKELQGKQSKEDSSKNLVVETTNIMQQENNKN